MRLPDGCRPYVPGLLGAKTTFRIAALAVVGLMLSAFPHLVQNGKLTPMGRAYRALVDKYGKTPR